MKKHSSTFLAAFCLALFALPANASDVKALDASLKAAYEGAFYPGVIRYADEILAEESASISSARAFVYKGEALYRLARLDEAIACLKDASSIVNAEAAKLDAPAELLVLASGCNYWLGRALRDKTHHNAALESFLQGAKNAQSALTALPPRTAEPEAKKASRKRVKDAATVLAERASDYYAYSLYYAALSFYDSMAPARAIPLLRYVLAHGSSYSLAEYEHAALTLATSYNALTHYAECDALCAQLEGAAQFTDATRYRLILHRGDAQAGLKHFKEAYDCYCRVLAECSSSLAAYAMQKAYEVSSTYRAQVGEEPGAVLAKAQARLADYPDLVSEFWLRLAIDAYAAGDMAKAAQYFDEAEKDGSRDIVQKAGLYRAEMAVQGGASGSASEVALQARAQEALSLLAAVKSRTALTADDALYASYAASSARYAALAEDWKTSISFADTALSTRDAAAVNAAAYWKAWALYASGAYIDCTKFIESRTDVGNTTAAKTVAAVSESPLDPSLITLYARALAKAGRQKDADTVFSALASRDALDASGHLDYAKSLMSGGYLVSAAAQAEKATGAEASYIAALAAFNRRDWQSAESAFTKALSASLAAPYAAYAEFYCGYAQYRSGKHGEAFRTLTDFIQAYPEQPLRFVALTTAVRASVQAGDYESAFPLADEAVRAASSSKEKQEAVLLCAGVYADNAQFAKALSVLSPYVERKDEFGYQCRYKAAQIQIQQKDYAAAEQSYAALAKELDAGALAEEAAYRHAELVYATDQYDKAVPLFDAYRRQWASGQFFDAALFFAGSAFVKMDATDRAILYYTQLDDLRKNSTYKYAAEKNLVELYKEQKDYEKAISYAKKLLSSYGEQAKKDGIEQAIKELELLELGYDEPTAAKEREYNTLGGARTAEGRAAGTELAALWSSSLISKQKAAALAEKLLASQKANLPKESAQAAKNALLVARFQRDQSENLKAAEAFLSAAEYGRMAGDDALSAQALYGAVEAFDAVGRYGDSQQTARSLSALYPKSHYTSAAKAIVAGQLY